MDSSKRRNVKQGSNALRRMQQREMEQFERLFGECPGAPRGEPTADEHKAIQAAIKRHRKNVSELPKS